MAAGEPWLRRHRGRLRTSAEPARATTVGADDMHLQQVGRHRGLAVLYQPAGPSDGKCRSTQQPPGLRAQCTNAVGDRRPPGSTGKRMATVSAVDGRVRSATSDRSYANAAGCVGVANGTATTG